MTRILVVGAGRTGARVIAQLRKNPDLEILTADGRDRPYAVEQGVIQQVDYQEALTPLTLEHVVRQAKPDLILLTTTTEDLGLGKAPGMDLLAEALRDELAAVADTPVILVQRAGAR